MPVLSQVPGHVAAKITPVMQYFEQVDISFRGSVGFVTLVVAEVVAVRVHVVDFPVVVVVQFQFQFQFHTVFVYVVVIGVGVDVVVVVDSGTVQTDDLDVDLVAELTVV